jgi:hypothetical protein
MLVSITSSSPNQTDEMDSNTTSSTWPSAIASLPQLWGGGSHPLPHVDIHLLSAVPDASTNKSVKSFFLTEALALYHRLKGGGKTN